MNIATVNKERNLAGFSEEILDLNADKVDILIVDDLPEKILVYESILQDLGQNLIFARSGEEALKQVLKNEFAVILLDVNMPGMNGFETASLIQKRKKSAHMPIIFLTAFTDEIRMAQGYASGAVDYLPTPVVPEVLRAKVKVFIELSKMRRQAALQAEERALRTAAEKSNQRSQFLVSVSEALARVQNKSDLLRLLTQLPIPFLSERTLIWFKEKDTLHGSLNMAWQGSYGDIETTHCADDLALSGTELMKAMHTVYDAHIMEYIPKLPAQELDKLAGTNGQKDEYSALVLPLSMRNEVFGTFVLMRKYSDSAYPKTDISLAHELTSRASVALENTRLVEKIKEDDRRKDEFLATLAHELRNPLAPIHNALKVMKMTADQRIIEEAQSTIERQVTQMIRLVEDLMDVSRITKGKIDLRKDKIMLKTILEHAVETSKPLIQKRHHKLTLNAPDKPIWLNADPSRMSQIFSNLLNNAAKYTDDGGSIVISVVPKEKEVTIVVQDNGIGIPREKLSDIFNIFSQVDASLERAQGGLGIGLTLVKSLVHMHDGTIEAYSEGVNNGSSFIVHLPISESEGKAETVEPLGQNKVSKPLRILIVDDNEASAQTLGWMAEFSGHKVHLAHEGKKAIEIAYDYKPQVVLLDIGLPGMNGYDVCKAMHENPALSDTVFIAQTGWGQAEHRKLSQEAGFHHHLVKPVDMNVLLKLLSDVNV